MIGSIISLKLQLQYRLIAKQVAEDKEAYAIERGSGGFFAFPAAASTVTRRRDTLKKVLSCSSLFVCD
ncbi:hypothetical protein D7M11_27015 [Paenibacillus ginsengarvi]|uniref:Uncharacterized protein n=1 Tax=Paenibacillus ginsengarvi TaxID=400777 RepID=A0A3B0BQ56_9BACL|nr:hypothetical protein D7M11_27015 [Paenibacillus ginsengarvi]